MSVKRLIVLPLALAVVLMSAIAPPITPIEAPAATPMRFIAVDVHVDSDQARLGAWQIEYEATGAPESKVMLVGVEGGEHAAYSEAPRYDPAALSGGRIIIASYTTDNNAPLGLTRVARLHLSVMGVMAPEHSLRLIAAGDDEGIRIEPKVWASEFTPDASNKNDTNTEDKGPLP